MDVVSNLNEGQCETGDMGTVATVVGRMPRADVGNGGRPLLTSGFDPISGFEIQSADSNPTSGFGKVLGLLDQSVFN